MSIEEKPIKTFVLDLFCGAGGTTESIVKAKTNIEVFWCVNHDKNAILSHKENHSEIKHSIEDIRTIKLSPILERMKELSKLYPGCKFALWASLECTNHSNAKNGPKDADSRTLAEHIFRYLDFLNFDFLWIENVHEFRKWGPLDEEGNPIKKLEGQSYKRWKQKLTSKYFDKKHKDEVLNSADYGARTIRKRLFLQFAKDKRLLGNAEATHCENGMFGPKWLPVKDILDLTDVGSSMFNRKKDFVVKTHRRILLGLYRFGSEEGIHFGYKYYGQGGYVDINNPCCTLTTKDRVSLVSIKAICVKENYGNSSVRDIEKPLGTITTVPKNDLILTHENTFMHNPQYGGTNRSVNRPSCTYIARQDKAPLGITSTIGHRIGKKISTKEVGKHLEVKNGSVIYYIRETDDKYMKKIKFFMYENNLIDITVRPLTIEESLQVQGFPKNYKLVGTKSEQKKYIGNSVEIETGVALIKGIDLEIQKQSLL